MKPAFTKTTLWSIAIKVVVLGVLVFALYAQLTANSDLQHMLDYLKTLRIGTVLLYCIPAEILMFVNWSIEAYKWKLLIQKLTPIRFIRAFKGVWTGVTLGLFTPNRVGEFGGRILYVRRKFRVRAVLATLIGSYSQNLATICAGMIGLVLYLLAKEEKDHFLFIAITGICVLAGTLLVLGYYNLGNIVRAFRKTRFYRRFHTYFDVFQLYHARDYTRLLLWSVARYAVYTAQYLIFLYLFGAGMRLQDGLTAISVIYLVQTAIPSFAIAELFTRGNIAMFFLSRYGVDNYIAVAASTAIWMLNLIVPAILGYFFILRFNIFKNRQS